jgi:hypothetical protein
MAAIGVKQSYATRVATLVETCLWVARASWSQHLQSRKARKPTLSSRSPAAMISVVDGDEVGDEDLGERDVV